MDHTDVEASVITCNANYCSKEWSKEREFQRDWDISDEKAV